MEELDYISRAPSLRTRVSTPPSPVSRNSHFRAAFTTSKVVWLKKLKITSMPRRISTPGPSSSPGKGRP